jgi:hypothetical protein
VSETFEEAHGPAVGFEFAAIVLEGLFDADVSASPPLVVDDVVFAAEGDWWRTKSAALDENVPDFADRFPNTTWLLSQQSHLPTPDDGSSYVEQQSMVNLRVGLGILPTVSRQPFQPSRVGERRWLFTRLGLVPISSNSNQGRQRTEVRCPADAENLPGNDRPLRVPIRAPHSLYGRDAEVVRHEVGDLAVPCSLTRRFPKLLDDGDNANDRKNQPPEAPDRGGGSPSFALHDIEATPLKPKGGLPVSTAAGIDS